MRRRDNVFTETMMSPVDSNTFDLSHEKKFTFSMGELVPHMLLEVMPGDKFSMDSVNLARFMPLIAPVMHKVRLKSEFFFVPNRIVYGGWEGFITGTDNPVLAAPTITFDDVVPEGCIADYLGIPPGDYSNESITVSVLPFAAYFKCFDEWYRDQNLISETYVDLVPGDNSLSYLPKVLEAPLRRAWEHDYFTSCSPFTQQGNTEVELPLVNQQNIPVEFNPSAGFKQVVVDPVTGAPLAAGTGNLNPAAGPVPFAQSLHSGATPAAIDPGGTMVVDIQAEAATINDLREAFSLQAFLERSIRGGLRYIEQILSHFGVRSSDSRLQRPEMIGRQVQNMTIGEVLATAQSTDVAIGQLAGHGISVGGGDNMSYYSEEHGYIIGFISCIPDTSYQDGIARHFFRTDRLDYPWPSFAHLGEQPVYRKELRSALGLGFDPDAIFGYIPRYSEMRYEPSRVAGAFRSTLAYWTLGRVFDSPTDPPGLNEDFVTCNPRTDIFAVTDPEDDHIVAQIVHKVTVRRKLPRFGIPSSL